MNTISAFADYRIEFFNASLTAIVDLSCRARSELTCENSEHDCAKHRGIPIVKRAVYEYLICINGARNSRYFLPGFFPPSWVVVFGLALLCAEVTNRPEVALR